MSHQFDNTGVNQDPRRDRIKTTVCNQGTSTVWDERMSHTNTNTNGDRNKNDEQSLKLVTGNSERQTDEHRVEHDTELQDEDRENLVQVGLTLSLSGSGGGPSLRVCVRLVMRVMVSTRLLSRDSWHSSSIAVSSSRTFLQVFVIDRIIIGHSSAGHVDQTACGLGNKVVGDNFREEQNEQADKTDSKSKRIASPNRTQAVVVQGFIGWL
ncbi:hypothetical protein WICPIJ_005437 [Wickerhamomyces pijperi]|uniref:Uncharacterized protein n=1 Tax=Wickerhamomyces pijperi TaxID=599730 RepID=A0A9P8Q5Z4_WICPI|nr:hypothetical protein WICPIJ_005437 [Wickerhamomyces pijperi]